MRNNGSKISLLMLYYKHIKVISFFHNHIPYNQIKRAARDCISPYDIAKGARWRLWRSPIDK
jgi:hypothetical protein